MNIELYINGQLCDIGNPRDLGIVLKRVFIKPSELNTKDAQKSYEITLPATPHNNEIFAHINIEEVQGKFTTYPDALLYIDGVKILDGKFRLSSISRDSYRGNLGVPAPATIKDIFGETTMNQAGKWMIPFNGVPDLAYYNALDYKDVRSKDSEYNYGNIPPCIFPFVLYKLLPKESANGIYTAKDELDNSVNFSLDDFPPSVNCVHMLRQIFKNAGYNLTGSALNDPRINNLYVSYKNPNEHEIQWGTGEIKIEGSWGNLVDGVREQFRGNTDLSANYGFIIAEIMKYKNSRVRIIKDSGANVSQKNGITKLTVPATGLYKVRFNAGLKLPKSGSAGKDSDGISIIPGTLSDTSFEVKVLRNFDSSQIDIYPYLSPDNVFARNNINQEPNQEGNIYPQEGEVNFIDPYQNPYFICGFSWGNIPTNTENYDKYQNPHLEDEAIKHNPMATTGGISWTMDSGDDGIPKIESRIYSAVRSKEYTDKYGNGSNNIFKVELEGVEYPGTMLSTGEYATATGWISQVVWLEKGDDLSILMHSSMKRSVDENNFRQWHWINQQINYELSLQPFRHDIGWLKINEKGASTEPMKWNDTPTFINDRMNLMQTMPTGVKVNDWIDNFCKAFNLNLINTGNKNFELNIKKRDVVINTSSIIDLDRKAHINLCQNEPLGLPYLFDLGFTIDTSEEGYYESMTDKDDLNSGYDGGGQFYTGSMETSKVEQKSSFSYCWYKRLKDNTHPGNDIYTPVVTDHEVWENPHDYKDQKETKYYDKTQRFWYRHKTMEVIIGQQENRKTDVALVANEYADSDKPLSLDYENKAESIMGNYFLLLTGEKNYTSVECNLTAEEYARLPYSLARLNGDLYNIAEADGYDPLGSKKTKLRLIKRIKS